MSETLPECLRCNDIGAHMSIYFPYRVRSYLDNTAYVIHYPFGFTICSCPAGKQHPGVEEPEGPEQPPTGDTI